MPQVWATDHVAGSLDISPCVLPPYRRGNTDEEGDPVTFYDNWKTTDPNLEAPRCPECEGNLEGDKYEGYCEEEGCDYTYTTDYEAILEVRYY
jgi:hypothetical protein